MEATLQLLKEHPGLYQRVLDASNRNCTIVEFFMNMISGLATSGKILHSPVDVNKLTVEDILSLLPGESITTTFMYCMIENVLLNHVDSDIIPPSTMGLYLQTPDEAHTMELASFFRPIEVASATEVKIVYVLPPATRVPHALAICSVAPSDCSTLLVGTPEATERLKVFLRKLFGVIFSPESPDHADPVLAGFRWDRFHEVPVEPFLQACHGEPNDTGTALVAISCESVFAGPRGVLDLLGVGVLHHDFPKSVRVLDIRHKALRNILVRTSYLEPVPDALRTSAVVVNSHMGGDEAQGDAHSDVEEEGPVHEGHEHLDEEEEDLVNENEDKIRFETIANAANQINLDDNADIEHRINEALSADERSSLEFTAEDEIVIMASVKEQGTPDLTDDIQKSTTNYRNHCFAILSSTVKFILATESTKSGWSGNGVQAEWRKFFIANATDACRKRVLRLLTDSRFQPVSF